MIKLLGWLLKILLSFFLFVAIAMLSAFATPYLTAEHYRGNETPHGQFRVLVKVFDDADKQTPLRAVTWSEYSEKKNTYEAYRSLSEGGYSNGPLWCRAKNISPGKQLIELRYNQENFRLYNKYYVTNKAITPLYFRIMDPGNAMLGVFLSLILTPTAVLCFGLFRKRLKKKGKTNRGKRTGPSGVFNTKGEW